MVSTEIVEPDAVEVHIVRTKGGIKNVAYIADNDTSLIVKKSTCPANITKVPTGEASDNVFKDNISKNKAFCHEKDSSECLKLPIKGLIKNLNHEPSKQSFCRINKANQMNVSFEDDREINIELELQKVYIEYLSREV